LHGSLWEGIGKVAAMLARAFRLPPLEPTPQPPSGCRSDVWPSGGAGSFYAFRLIRTRKDLLLNDRNRPEILSSEKGEARSGGGL
jgi:hypothetical protein